MLLKKKDRKPVGRKEILDDRYVSALKVEAHDYKKETIEKFKSMINSEKEKEYLNFISK